MAVTTAQTVDVSQALAMLLGSVDGLRVEWYVSDRARVPCAVVSLPTLTFDDPDSGFCWALWDYSIALVTARSDPRAAQEELSRLVRDVVNALSHQAPEGIYDIQMLSATPSTTTIAGQELPSYIVRCQVRA